MRATSKYPLRKMLRFASDGIIGFSTAPLRLVIGAGLLLAIVVGRATACLPSRSSWPACRYVPGYASLLVTITFLSGVQLAVIGMVGQYVARIYDEARARPLYLVRDARGFHPSGPGAHFDGPPGRRPARRHACTASTFLPRPSA